MLWPVLERSTAICMTRRRTRATLSGHAGRVLRFSIYLYPECIYSIYLTPPPRGVQRYSVYFSE